MVSVGLDSVTGGGVSKPETWVSGAWESESRCHCSWFLARTSPGLSSQGTEREGRSLGSTG